MRLIRKIHKWVSVIIGISIIALAAQWHIF